MNPEADSIRRSDDGSIDSGFYLQRAAALRAAEQRKAPGRLISAARRLGVRLREAIESILLFPAGKA